MELKDLEIRMYVLAGQLEEAKKVYRDALGEIERVNKEQANRKTETVTTPSDSEVSIGEQAAV